MAKKSAAEAANEKLFTKEALVGSKHFIRNRDLVSALLEDGKEYTIKEVEEQISKYLKGKVN